MFVKAFLLGAASVGKTQLLNRFCSGKNFQGFYTPTTGPDFSGTKVTLKSGEECIIQMWDYPGPAGSHQLTSAEKNRLLHLFEDTHVGVLVCDIMRKATLTHLITLVKSFAAASASSGSAPVSFVLLINKSEMSSKLKQEVFPEDVIRFCTKFGVDHVFETSAAMDTNIMLALMQIAEIGADVERRRRGVKVDPYVWRREIEEHRQRRLMEERLKAEAEAEAEEARARAEHEARLREQEAQERAKKEEEEERALRAGAGGPGAGGAGHGRDSKANLADLHAQLQLAGGGGGGGAGAGAAADREEQVRRAAEGTRFSRETVAAFFDRFSAGAGASSSSSSSSSSSASASASSPTRVLELGYEQFASLIARFGQRAWVGAGRALFCAFAERGRRNANATATATASASANSSGPASASSSCVSFVDFVQGLDALLHGPLPRRAELVWLCFCCEKALAQGHAHVHVNSVTQEDVFRATLNAVLASEPAQRILEAHAQAHAHAHAHAQQLEELRRRVGAPLKKAVHNLFGALGRARSFSLGFRDWLEGVARHPEILALWEYRPPPPAPAQGDAKGTDKDTDKGKGKQASSASSSSSSSSSSAAEQQQRDGSRADGRAGAGAGAAAGAPSRPRSRSTAKKE